MGDFIERDVLAQRWLTTGLESWIQLLGYLSVLGKRPKELIKIIVRPVSSKTGCTLPTFTFVRGLLWG